MDPLSQGVVGAIAAQSASPREEVRSATFAGFVAGILADADIFTQSADDPLLWLDYHRHFTHSLLFIPVGKLVAAVLVWPFVRKRLAFPNIYLFTTLGYATCGLLDACTSYGTQLLWPFSDRRIAWSNIAISDPVFTLTVAAMVVLSLVKKRALFARLGIAFALVYLTLGVFQRERAEEVFRDGSSPGW